MMHSDGERAESGTNLPDIAPVFGQPKNVLVTSGLGYGHVPSGNHLLPPGLASKPSVWTILKALKRRWLLAATLGIVAAAAAAAAAWFLIPPRYSAQAFVYLPARPKFILAGERGNAENQTVTFQKSQAALLKDTTVLEAALTKGRANEVPLLHDRANPVEWLEKELIVDFPASPEYMRVTLYGDRPQDLLAIVNAVLDAYIDAAKQNEENEREKRLTSLRDLGNSYWLTLRSKRTAYDALRQTLGTGDPFVLAVNQQFLHERLNARQKEWMMAQSDLAKAKIALDADESTLKANVDPIPPEGLIEAILNTEPINKAYVLELAQKEKSYQEAASRWSDGEKNPRMLVLKEEIEALKRTIAVHHDQSRPAVVAKVQARMRSDAKDKMAILQKSMEKDQAYVKSLENEVNDLSKKVKAEKGSDLDLESQKDEVTQTSATYRRIRDQQELLELEKNAPPRVPPEKARIHQALAQQRQVIFASMAGIGAFALVLGLVGYLEFQTRRINHSDDVVYGLGWRLVGALPALPDRGMGRFGRGRIDDKYWHSILTESVDATRTMLLHAAKTEGVRTVMVTSAVAGEGKTSLSCHLATSLARGGRKTLLIDCDLRSPAAHRLFELSAVPGFSEVLRGEVNLTDVIHATPASNLWLIPAGRCDAQTLQSLAQDAIAPILEQLKQQYDFIVIDSSPVLPVVDALVIGQNVDVVIFSLLRDVSRIPNVYAAYQRLATLGIRMLGAVVNGVLKDAYGASYHYYAKQSE
ncbi:MAG TPA: polysaccharide biosynthesis tyrosine autokinase [Gemmataceae bacterium]|nr:polysaccharide biosynthesis tyrosine autokinase [Gemmataceae bacterium]